MQRYFTKEDINRLFSGSLTKAESEKRKDLAMKFLDVALDHKSGLADIEAARSKFPAPSVTDSDTNASIRYDLKFPAGGPPDFPFEMWFDHAIVHETSQTYAEDLLRFLRQRQGDLLEGPAFRKMKTNKYSA